MLQEIVSFLDGLLETSRVPEKYASNGLQVDGPSEVKRVGFCVDACQHTFQMLYDCQLIVVHHGLFWPSVSRITGPLASSLRTLIANGSALYASHLPLDVHPVVGNNAQLIDLLGLKRGELFAPVGYLAETEAISPGDLHRRVEERIGPARLLDFGSGKITRIAVSSGQASTGMVTQAVEQGAQLLLTGEASHPLFHAAGEAGLGVILAGHYATETWGVRALMPLLEEKFGVRTRFLDLPTGF